VFDMIVERIPATLKLAGAALFLSVVVGIPLGVYAALRQYSFNEQLLSFFSFLGLALPNFWLGILLIILFSVNLGWLPSSGMQTVGAPFSITDRLLHLLMPASVLATSAVAQLMRYARSSWLEVQRMDYVTVARAKGLTEFMVQSRHVLKNAMIPVVTILGLRLPLLVGGSAVVETLFAWPGMGRLAVDAASRRDTPLVLGCVLFVSIAVILSNLVIDLLYPYLDPRLRRQ
jgi:peptide/nickel transport system permease protein